MGRSHRRACPCVLHLEERRAACSGWIRNLRALLEPWKARYGRHWPPSSAWAGSCGNWGAGCDEPKCFPALPTQEGQTWLDCGALAVSPIFPPWDGARGTSRALCSSRNIHPHHPSQPAPILWGADPFFPSQLLSETSANLSWRQVLPVRASCPPGRLLPSFSARAVLPPPFAELSACVQLPAFGQPGDASPTQSTKGPISHTALQSFYCTLRP